ncbi:sensor histidine kinase [Streptomyces radicis]|uniref:histidine kinase n=1 Tax=Streptomyces radicis TaxID=1750517 RepID=A0A3A9VX02_9ACTN|nr:sensor domain-containing protein [Streptomyces radicis]RKN05511.1 sensor histidine kinase [Streptomyces radicis]RKN17380.1 sensor histidine kinase [Streptomyces radicis]
MTSSTSPGRAEPLPPPRGPLGRGTWREIGYLLSSWPLALATFLCVVVWLWTGAFLSLTVIGLPVLAIGLSGLRRMGAWERARARALLDVRVDEPSALRRGRGGGFLAWLWSALKDPVGWRTALFFVVRLPLSTVTFWLTFALMTTALWPVLPWVVRWFTQVDRALVTGLLSPSDELERRIAELESDRATVTDAASADLRRIERDLHDGAQARLVALAMDLGLAKEKLTEDPEAAARMVDEAHGEVKLALQELRDLARGIHPAILTDRGLGPALSAVASRCTVPVRVTAELPTRPAPAIEGIAYYVVSELLQNVSKHSGARHADVECWRSKERLMLQVTDDGHGGADAEAGSGLAGLAERLAAVDGVLVVVSPPGGPTTITAELPWRSRTTRATSATSAKGAPR